MTEFKKTNIRQYLRTKEQTAESIYWRKFSECATVKEYGPIDYIHFSSLQPHFFAATSSARVHVYNAITKAAYKKLNRFKETAYGGTFRNDGLLLVAGSNDSIVRLFDVSTKTQLRQFKGHCAAVHRTFFTLDNVNVVSFSDDKTVKLWDVSTEQQITSFQNHRDYVRAGCISPVSNDIILSGGYDNTINMFDTRSKGAVMTLDHGAPVESILFLPSGGVFVTAGQNEIKVWDALTKCLLAKCCQFHKTVTCMCLARNGTRILTGSIDRKVKIINTMTYKVAHTMTFPSGILSIAASRDEQHLAIGTVDGTVLIRSRKASGISAKREEGVATRRIPNRFMRELAKKQETKLDVVEKVDREILSSYETALRHFQYNKAVDIVMAHGIAFKKPWITIALFQELIKRRGLKSSLSGREEKSLTQIVQFVVRYIRDIRYAKVLIEVTECFADVYEPKIQEFSKSFQILFRKLHDTIKDEENFAEELLKLQGMLEMLTVASERASSSQLQPNANLMIQPLKAVVSVK